MSIDDELVLVVFQTYRPSSSCPHRRGPRLSPTLFGGQLSTCFRRSSTGLSQQSLPWLNISRTSTFGGYPDISFYLGVQVHHYSPGLNISTMLPTSGRLISGSLHLPASRYLRRVSGICRPPYPQVLFLLPLRLSSWTSAFGFGVSTCILLGSSAALHIPTTSSGERASPSLLSVSLILWL